MFTVLQTVDADPANPTGDFVVGEVAVFVGRNYVLSVRRKSPFGFQNVRARAEAEPEQPGTRSGFVLYAIMDTVVDRYFPVLAQAGSRPREAGEPDLPTACPAPPASRPSTTTSTG